MNPKLTLNEYQSKINKLLNNIDFEKTNTEFNILFGKFARDFIERGGKRIRPILISLTYKIFSDKNLDAVIETSLFVEFIQAWMLIHDDIMDHDDMRRGGPTVHKMFEKIADDYNFEDKKDFGNTFGILAGDFSILFVMEILGKSKLPGDIIKKILEFTSKELQNVIYGQNLDIITSKNIDYSESDILKIYDLKTARYTFIIPCVCGAIMAEASQKDIDILTKFSIPVGIAFQIRDDILGLFGKEEETGKSNTGDIEEGKRTILVWKTYQNANKEQKTILNKYFGQSNLSLEQVGEFKKIVKETGALDYAEELCSKYVNEAKEALKALPNQQSEGWQFLNWIADYMLERDK